MAIIIENMQEQVKWDSQSEAIIRNVIMEALKEENFSTEIEVSILLVDNKKIREMNQEYRSIDRETDVLSFPMIDFTGENGGMDSDIIEWDYDPEEKVLLLGDIVISLEMAVEQAREYGHSFERELGFLTAHGIFHLLGYDHETAQEEAAMREKEERVLMQLGLAR